MSINQSSAPPVAGIEADSGHQPHGGLAKLVVGAVGIVFGDIGTSPIYALRDTFVGHHPLAPDRDHIFGVLSLIFWSMMIVVTLKYVVILLRADNKGEGGSLALLALINRKTPGRRWSTSIILLGVFATALFYGDSMITPAMSVLSASEGLAVVNPGFFGPLVLPISIILLLGLFLIQSSGTAKVGALFGPIMLIYFFTLAVLGGVQLAANPGVLLALNPYYAFNFFMLDGVRAYLALGSVVLAITGAEALYADMGHFGRRPIRVSWIAVVAPALMLNYLGQGAMILNGDIGHANEMIKNPFFLLAPEMIRLPVVLLAMAASLIASQAVISGAFSLTQQAIQLGFIPRLHIRHTSASAAGQIYIPVINWGLMIMVMILVLVFRTSSNLGAAYGIAVTGAMAIDTILLAVVIFALWRWNVFFGTAIITLFAIVDIAYLTSNLTKVPAGGWFPLAVGLFIFTLLTTWATGRKLMTARLHEASMPIKIFIASAATSATRVPGTAVFMTSASDGVPHALLHNLKHNKVLHERIILLTVQILDVPYVHDERRCGLEDLGSGFHRLVVQYGFMQEINVPEALMRLSGCGAEIRMMDTSFFLSRQTLLASARPGMALWREKLFAWMLRNAETAMEFFRIPPNRVVELGSQVEI